MFTGIVEEKGKLVTKKKTGEGYQLTFSGKIVTEDLKIGDSVAINGVCLTVVSKEEDKFFVDVIEETLKKSNLGELEENGNVNFERSLKADARLGGHFVLGHVDTKGTVIDIKELSNSHWMTIEYPKEFMKNLIYVGSVSIDGVSMTVAELEENRFSVGIIPHTWQMTVFSDKKIGSTVNLEFDVLGKYVEKIMNPQQ